MGRQATNVSVWKHPRSAYYQGALFMARGGAADVERLHALNPPSVQEVLYTFHATIDTLARTLLCNQSARRAQQSTCSA